MKEIIESNQGQIKTTINLYENEEQTNVQTEEEMRSPYQQMESPELEITYI